MNKILRVLALAILCLGTTFSTAYTQPQISCPAVSVGNDTLIQNGNRCVDLTARPVSGFQPTTYTVQNVPYNPYPFNVGTAVLLNIDDRWSAALPIPFNFCFYGNTYNQCIVGSNGILSFDVAAAGGFCPWAVNVAIPSPLNPMNCIMGPWHDIDPSIAGTVRWATYGVAPCRVFVVSWDQCAMFSCTAQRATQQIAIYETTNIIEVYIQNKPVCAAWNGGDAIEGVHNATGTAAVVVPGRNFPTNWTANNDGVRFVPAGPINYAVDWYEVGNMVSIGSGTTLNVCPSQCSTDYYAEVTYTNCDNSTVTVTDTLNVTFPPMTINGVVTNVSCNGANDGSITATPVGGLNPYTYAWAPIGGTGPTASNLPPGTYYITITDSVGCTALDSFVVTEPPAITATPVITNVSCNGGNDGSITINSVMGGAAPYTYSLNGGPFQAGNSFTGLTAGSYTVVVQDANGCQLTLTPLIVTEPPAMTATPVIVNVSCIGGNDGSITINNVMGGAAPYTYSLNGGPFQASNTFNGLAAGSYTVVVQDANGCQLTLTPLVVTEPAGVTATPAIINVSCNGGNDGSITINNVLGGTAPYTYSLNGGPFQAGNAFTGLTAGSYTVVVQDANGCQLTLTPLIITEPAAIMASDSIINASCNGGMDGEIWIINVSGGTAPYQYNLNGGAFQPGNSFTGLTAGAYTVIVQDANGCQLTLVLAVSQSTPMVATDSLIMVTCNGGNDGEIWINGVLGGTAPYTYSLNGGPFQAGNGFAGLTAGSYTVAVQDANGCQITLTPLIITEPAAITATPFITNVSCNGGNDGSITINNVLGGTAPYTYSLNGGPFQAGNSFPGLTAGSYTVVVQDANGCQLTLTPLIITEPAAITATPVITNVSCNGGNDGAITINNVTGGTAPYTYSLNGGPFQAGNNFPGLTAGSYTVVVQDANGCQLTLTPLIITEPAAIMASDSIINASCNGGMDGEIWIINVSGGTAPYQYNLNGGAFQPGNSFTGLTAGAYTVIVQDANGCQLTLVLAVSQGTPLAATDSLIMVSCNGGNDGEIRINNTSGGTAPYQYNLNGGAFQPGNSFTGLTAGNYTVVVQDANNCQTTIAPLVITEPAPLMTSDSITHILCNGDNTGEIWLNNTAGGTPPYQYNLNGGAFQAGNSFAGLTAGNYTIVVQDANNCQLTVGPLVVNEPQALSAQDSVQAASCQPGNDGEIWIINTAGGIAPYAYSLNGGAFQAVNSFTNLAAGNYQVVVRDANGCTDTLNPFVFQPSGFAATDSLVHLTCPGSGDGEVWIQVSGGTVPFLYSFNGGPFQGNNSAAGLPAGPVTIVVEDSNMCQFTLNVVLTEPTAVTSGDSTVAVSCAGGNDGEVWITGATGGTPPYVYSLNGGAFQSNNAFTGLTAGNYTLEVRDSNGCTYAFGPAVVTEPATLQANDSTVNARCNASADGELWIVGLAGGTPAYEFSLDSLNWLAGNGFSGLTAGNYTAYVRDANGCVLVLTASIGEPTALTISVTSTPTTCGQADGTATVVAGGGTPGYTYLWSNGQNGATATGLGAGSHMVVITDANGCSDSASVTVAALGLPTAAVIAAGDALCNGGTDGFAVASGSGGTAPYSFQWLNTPVTSDSLNGVGAGTYTVVVTDSLGCSDTAMVTLGEPSALVLSGTATDPTCFQYDDGSATVTAAGGTPGYSYLWSSVPAQTAPTANLLTAGGYTVLVVDANGCTDSLHVTLTDPAQVIADFTSNPPIPGQLNITNASVSFQNLSQNADFYDWAFDDGSSSTESDPTHTYTQPGDFCVLLTATDSAGCQDTMQLCAYNVFEDEFVIPNTFTPNGDGRNDVFEIVGIGQFPNNKLMVFNRWGNKVYEKEQYDNSWTGTNWKSGKPLPDGGYFYIFQTGVADRKDVMGDVVIFR